MGLPKWVVIHLSHQPTPQESTLAQDGQAFLQLHFSRVFMEWAVKCRSCFPIPSCHLLEATDSHPLPTTFVPPPIDLTGVSQKQAPEECVTQQSKPKKKRRVQKKKPDIVVLDDLNDEGDVQKNIGHWKDHWVIQLITVRGEMHSIFSAPPKQGNLLQFPSLCE